MEPAGPRELAGRIASLHIYPVKSCAGISVDAWPLDAFGLYGDRRYMIVRPDGGFVTQREQPRLALIRTALDDPRARDPHLEIGCPGAPPLRVPFSPTRGEWIDVSIWRDRVRAIACNAEADRWLSSFLGERVRLVFFSTRTVRAVDTRYATSARTAFADGYPLLLVGQASLDELNARLAHAVPMDRFRPNLVVAGALAYAEDGWGDVSIGGVPLRVVKPCARCAIVMVDQATGETAAEPLRTLATYRRRGNDVLFGQNVVHLERGVLRVGDPVLT